MATSAAMPAPLPPSALARPEPPGHVTAAAKLARVREAARSVVRPGWRELAGATLLFLALSFAVYGWYAFNGGFIADDWVNADHYYFHSETGFWGAVHNYQTPSRPAAAVFVSLTYAVLGTDFQDHLALSVLLTAFLSIAFFAFLRTVGVGLAPALAAAALLLVFPSSDSTRFWNTANQINLFIGLYLVAATIAVRGRRRFGADPTPRAVLTQLLASALAATAVAGYEIVAPAVLLSVILYRLTCGSRGAIWRWVLDVVPTALVLFFFTRKFGGGTASGLQLLTNVHLLADGAVSVLGYTLYPVRTMSRWAVFVGVAGVVFVTLLVRRIAADTPDRTSIVRWLRPLLLAIAGIVVGYLMLVPVAERYPLYVPGVLNRSNCFAALGFSALVVFAMAAIAAMLVAVAPRLSEGTRSRLRGVLAALLVLGMLAAYTVRINQDAHRWEKASRLQTQVLRRVHALVPSPPSDSTIFTSPYAAYAYPNIPIFGGGGNNDELGAFKVSYDSEQLRAFPLFEGLGPSCGPTGMSISDAGNSETDYGKAILVDFRANTVYRPTSRRECVKDADAMMPFGPANLLGDW
jgi:hypothetical protein